MSKKHILVIAPWYPSPENPIAGSFFREQCRLLSQRFSITVLTWTVDTRPSARFYLKSRRDREPSLRCLGRGEDMEEYSASVPRPRLLNIRERVYNILADRRDGSAGPGSYRSPADLRFWERATAVMDREMGKRFDLVYAISSQGIICQARMFARRHKAPLVFGEHGPFPWPGKTIPDRDRESMAAADCFFAISHDKIRQIMTQNIPLRRICYVGNLVDERVFPYAPRPHECPTFLIVAAHTHYKNYDLFLRTMDRLTEITALPFRVIIAGYDANKGYSANAQELEDKVRASRFADRSELIGAVPREDMPALYQRADAFVMTSVQEGQPVSALEAACCGLPIFSTRCGGVEDYVTEELGRIVPIMDAEGLAEQLRQFLAGEIRFNGRRIRETVVSRFGREAYLETVSSVFRELIGER